MDASIINTALPSLPARTNRAAPALPQPAPVPAAGVKAEDPGFDVQAAEQRRFEAVRRASEAIANVYIVGDKRFTIFKDVTGQYVTRFTDLRDGKVTYIPEPQLLKRAEEAPVLNITA